MADRRAAAERRVRGLLRTEAAEFRVITQRRRYRLRRDRPVHWHDIEGLVNELYYEELERASDRYRAGTATLEEAVEAIAHAVWQRIATRFALTYEREDLDQ